MVKPHRRARRRKRSERRRMGLVTGFQLVKRAAHRNPALDRTKIFSWRRDMAVLEAGATVYYNSSWAKSGLSGTYILI